MRLTHTASASPALDDHALRHLAQRHSQPPLTGRALIGSIDGVPAAALALTDGRVIAEPTSATGHLVANLRVRAVATWAHATVPSLRDRMLAGLPVWYQAVATSTIESTPDTEQAEYEPVLVGA